MRLADWEARLADYLAGHRKAAFAYGRLDCVLFAAGAIAAMTGEDPAVHVRGHYRTRIGSLRKLTAEGFVSLPEMMDARFEAIGPAHARRGDIVMAGGSLGVCVGKAALFVGEADGEPGLVPLPLAAWERAWRVPFES